MKRIIAFGFVLFSFVLFSNFTVPFDYSLNPMVGTWDYEMMNEHYGVWPGELFIEQKEEELAIKMNIAGYLTEVKGVKANGNNLIFHSYAEGTKVPFDLDFDGNTFAGVAILNEARFEIYGARRE